MATDLQRGAPAASTEEDEERAVVAGLDELETRIQPPAGPGPGRRFVRSVLPPILFLVFLVVVWQLAYMAKIKPPYALPSPADVAKVFWQTVQDGRAAEAIWTSLSRGAIGFALSLVIGTLLGLAMWGRRWFILPNPVYGQWQGVLRGDPAQYLRRWEK